MAPMDSARPEPPAVRERAQALGEGVLAAVRRILEGPDGPLALAIVLALAALLQLALFTAGDGDLTGSMVVNLLATLPIALMRRRRLLVAAWVVTLATCLALVDVMTSLTLAALVAQLTIAYVVATRRRRRASALLTLALLVAVISVQPTGNARITAVLVLVLVVAAQALGDARRQGRQAIAERDETRRAMADTLRGQAAMEERARIARELHDVVAHHVSMVAVQAETARLTTPGMPPQGQERLAAIGDTARDALTEMRRLLGVLRSDAPGDAERSPQPGLDRLAELLDDARNAGTSVRLVVHGRVATLPPGIDLTAYRIVQEALTNARRHAPGAAVEVEVAFGDDVLQVRVRDDGVGGNDISGVGGSVVEGHGLLGMRERAAMVGGTLRAGAASGGGFAVEADLPIGEAAT
jgi:signal transduction histidine kinase